LKRIALLELRLVYMLLLHMLLLHVLLLHMPATVCRRSGVGIHRMRIHWMCTCCGVLKYELLATHTLTHTAAAYAHHRMQEIWCSH
jgi:hypothetical protein